MELLTLAEQEGKKLLGDVGQRAALPMPPLEFAVRGSHAAEIGKAAREWPADLIVTASHGRSGMGRFWRGSVAEAVTRQASCPVLIVRPRL